MVSDRKLAELAKRALGGGSANFNAVKIAVAVALAENRSASPTVTNKNKDGSTDTGLWQINSIHQSTHPTWTVEWLKNPENNAGAMAVVSSNGTNWTPWYTYKDGTYRKYLGRAEIATVDVADIGNTPIDIITDPAILPDPFEDTARAIGTAVETIWDAGAWLTNRENWGRIAFAGIGAIVIVTAVGIVAKPAVTETIKDVKPL